MSGYVRIHRSLLGHPAFRNESETMAFAWLIAKAAWRPTRVRYQGHSITLRRGQLAISIRDMAEAFGRDKAWVTRLQNRLISEAMIETCAETGVSVVTICNYDEYQGEADERETPREPRAETRGDTDARQRRDTEQRKEEGKKEDQSSRARAREPATLPTDVRSVMEEAGFVSPPPDLSLLKDWYAAGATLDQDILPCIRRVAPRLGKAPFKLKVFDAAIREKLAADEAEIQRLRAVTRRFEQSNQAGVAR
jgi:hypothetical protein